MKELIKTIWITGIVMGVLLFTIGIVDSLTKGDLGVILLWIGLGILYLVWLNSEDYQ